MNNGKITWIVKIFNRLKRECETIPKLLLNFQVSKLRKSKVYHIKTWL